MRKLTKAVAVAAPAIMALAAVTPAKAGILLMGDNGWEVTFGGSSNTFYMYSSSEEAPTGTRSGSLVSESGEDMSRLTVGLLPGVFGMSVKAPSTGGLDMMANLTLYPSTQNTARTWNGSANLNLRESYFKVSGDFGSLLVGRTLNTFGTKAIVSDMGLFGIGGQYIGDTTLGRIGYGYNYANFGAQIAYTLPTTGALSVKVAIEDPSKIVGGSAYGAHSTDISATQLSTPRGAISVGVSGGDLGSLTIEGMYQQAEMSLTKCNLAATNRTNAYGGTDDEKRRGDSLQASDCTVEALGANATLVSNVQGLGIVVSGFYGEGLGTFFNLDVDSLDGTGDERVHWGGYAQATFDAGGGTNVGVSYGGTYYGKQTQYDSRNHSSHATIKARELLSAMVWHNINDNLRLVAEYGHVEDEWNDGASRESDAVSVGGFFFWQEIS